MKKNILLFCILTVFIQNVQLIAQDFSEYKFCSQVAIDDVDNYRNKGAGITYNAVDNTIIMCLSDLSMLYVVDMDGTLLSTNPLVGFSDVEGLEIIDDNTLVLVEEGGRGNVVFLPLPLPTNQSINYPDSDQIIHCPNYLSNDGFESVAYDATNDILYWAKERNPITVFSLQNPRSYALSGQDLNPTSPWDINVKLSEAGIADFDGIAGMHFSKSNTLWVLSEDKNMMIEVDPITGDILQTFENSRLSGKLQGVTEGPSGEIIVMEHNSLYMVKFNNNCVTYNDCPKDASVFFDFEQGSDLCNLEEVSFGHWRRQKQAWIEDSEIKIEGAANRDYYFLLDEGSPYKTSDKEYFAEGSEIDLTGIVEPAVKFDYILDNFTLQFHISEDDGSTWEIVWQVTDIYTNPMVFPMDWGQIIIPLDNYIDKKIKFRFKVIQKKRYPFKYAPGISALDAIKFGHIDDLTCDDADSDGVCDADDQCPGPDEFCDNYCTPIIQGNSSDTYISRVTLENIDNPSGNGEYNDFTDQHSTDLIPSNTYTLQMEKPVTQPNLSLYWYVWIDYNGNNIFEDAELIVSLSNESANIISESFTVPADASIGQTRMRVYIKTYSQQTPEPPSPCDDTSELAEVEDYRIFISDGCEEEYNLSGNINPQKYEAEDYIISDGQVPAGGDVVFQAGNFIDLQPGFSVQSDLNSTFEAFIAPCQTSSSSKSDAYFDTDKMVAIRNYPNPFNGQTTIEFKLTEETPVTLSVSDATGRQVALLLNHEFRTEGVHLTTFDGSNYPVGIYYYTIQAGEYFGTQKMVLIK